MVHRYCRANEEVDVDCLRSWASMKRPVGITECGLDFHLVTFDKLVTVGQAQVEWVFIRQFYNHNFDAFTSFF